MSSQANITVFDGAATPVSHLLTATGDKILQDGTRYAIWREYNASLPTEACLTLEAYQRTLKSGACETTVVVKTPVLESVAGQNAQGYTAMPKVAYFETDKYVKISHPRSTGVIRNLNSQILKNVMSNVSTSVPAVSAGQIAFELIIQQLFPS